MQFYTMLRYWQADIIILFTYTLIRCSMSFLLIREIGDTDEESNAYLSGA